MKTYLSILKQIIIITFFILTLSCSDDPSSPKKEDEDPTPQETVTIGVDGGTVGNDDFMISIPAGAFDGNYNISLIKIEDDGTFGENTITPSFKMSGLPSNYSKPIKIIAKYSGELSEESYMGLSKKVYDIKTDSSIAYDLYSALDSLGYIVSSIPPKPISNLPKSISNVDELDDFEKLIKFLTSYTHSETEHFTIRYPVIYTEKIPLLAQVFEDAYTVVYDGFKKDYINISLDIILESINRPIYNELEVDLSNSTLTFYVNKDNVYNLQLNDIQVGAVQGLFLPSRLFHSSISWPDYAFYFWIEDLISDDPNYKFPDDFLFSGYEVFTGFNTKYSNPSPSDYKNESRHYMFHGLNMSVIIKYLREFRNMEYSAIGNYYRTSNYQTRITEFLNLVEDPITVWWSDFFKKYVNNELFELPDDYFIENAHAEWDINSEEDISKTFTSTYQDLSAKMFKINLNYADLDNTQNLKFKMMGPNDNKDLSLILFTINNNTLQYIETTKLAEYEIINPKSYFENGTGEFFAVLVNSNITNDDYLGNSDIDLTIKITPKTTISNFDLTFTKCSAVISINANLQVETEGSTETKTELLLFSSETTNGSFDGNTYTGSYNNPAFGGGYFSGEIVVTLNETLDTIKTATFSGLDENPDLGIRWEKGFSVKNIPISPYENNVFTTQYDNSNVCSSIINVNYINKQSSSTTTYIDHTCDEFSNISFTFSKD